MCVSDPKRLSCYSSWKVNGQWGRKRPIAHSLFRIFASIAFEHPRHDHKTFLSPNALRNDWPRRRPLLPGRPVYSFLQQCLVYLSQLLYPVCLGLECTQGPRVFICIFERVSIWEEFSLLVKAIHEVRIYLHYLHPPLSFFYLFRSNVTCLLLMFLCSTFFIILRWSK